MPQLSLTQREGPTHLGPEAPGPAKREAFLPPLPSGRRPVSLTRDTKQPFLKICLEGFACRATHLRSWGIPLLGFKELWDYNRAEPE